MKRITLLFTLLFLAGVLVNAMAVAQDHQHQMADPKMGQSKEQTKDVYTCPMHPEVISDKPGKCPKCGMKLQKVEATKEKNEMGNSAMKMDGMMGKAICDKSVDGLHARVWIITQGEHKRKMSSMKDGMKQEEMKHDMGDMKGMDMKAGAKTADKSKMMDAMMAGTHHVMVKVVDDKTGKSVSDGHFAIAVTAPSGKSSTIDLAEMMDHFGGGVSLTEKGAYKLALSFTSGAKTHNVKFEYEVK